MSSACSFAIWQAAKSLTGHVAPALRPELVPEAAYHLAITFREYRAKLARARAGPGGVFLDHTAACRWSLLGFVRHAVPPLCLSEHRRRGDCVNAQIE